MNHPKTIDEAEWHQHDERHTAGATDFVTAMKGRYVPPAPVPPPPPPPTFQDLKDTYARAKSAYTSALTAYNEFHSGPEQARQAVVQAEAAVELARRALPQADSAEAGATALRDARRAHREAVEMHEAYAAMPSPKDPSQGDMTAALQLIGAKIAEIESETTPDIIEHLHHAFAALSFAPSSPTWAEFLERRFKAPPREEILSLRMALLAKHGIEL